MLNVKGKNYKCYLLDANIIISLLKDREGFGSQVIDLVLNDGIFVFTPTTLWEISIDEALFEDFKDIFFTLPSILISSENEIVRKECENYDQKNNISISDIGIPFNKIYFEGHNIDIDELVGQCVSSSKSKGYKEFEKEAFLSFKEKSDLAFMGKYQYQDKKVVSNSIKLLAYEWVVDHVPEFARSCNENDAELSVGSFPSLLSKSYIYHYKFMSPNRKGEASDLSDILVSGALPYVDCYLTENSIANNIREIEHRYGFYKDLKVYVTRDINKLTSNLNGTKTVFDV